MTDHEREQNRYGSRADLSRARLRKNKREHQSGFASAKANEPKNRTAKRRLQKPSGPSMRERLAATQIKLPAPKIENIQGKLSSGLERVSRQLRNTSSWRPESSNNRAEPNRSNRRKAEIRRNTTVYEATTRAETQRKINSDNSFTPRKVRRLYDSRAESAPPVMVRGGMGGISFGRNVSSRINKPRIPKRRYDVPLKVQGAEVRLPSIPMFHLGWRALSLTIVLMMAASLVMVWKAPVFQVSTVKAEGIKRLTVGDLNAVMGTFGSSVFTINPNLLEETLAQAFPELTNISVKINLPGNMEVFVTEREPVIAWLQDGTEAWIDNEGVSFPPRGNPESSLVRVEGHGTPPGVSNESPVTTSQSLPPGVPITLASPLPAIQLTSTLVSSILSLGAKIPADTVLIYDSEHGLGWNDPNGWEVYFGAEDQDMQMKLNVYETLVEHLQSEGIQPALISVEYVHAPYYRMER